MSKSSVSSLQSIPDIEEYERIEKVRKIANEVVAYLEQNHLVLKEESGHHDGQRHLKSEQLVAKDGEFLHGIICGSFLTILWILLMVICITPNY